jgi:hypothetical protein
MPRAPPERQSSEPFCFRREVAALCGLGILFCVPGSPALAQAAHPAPAGSGQAEKPSPGSAVAARPPEAPRTAVSFDLAGGYSGEGEIQDTSGAAMGSTSVYGRIALLVPVGRALFLSFPLDAAVTFYRFRNDPLLLPEGGTPWDQVRTYSIGVQMRYAIDQSWALLAGANLASSGARGSSFGDTLTGGGTLGFSYSFSRELTLGVLVTAQSQLSGGVFVIPFPILDWVLPFGGGRWRLAAGALRVGPGRAGGVGLLYTPWESLTFSAAIAFLGLGREFRLPRTGAVFDRVGRDSAYPLLLGAEWRPIRQLSLSAFGGVSILRALTVLDGAGNTLAERDVKPSPVAGGRIALAL